HLRQKFLNSQAALTGVNFAIAETGGVVTVTNEGNANMGVHLSPIQIHSMGIEKVIPKAEHLGVFTRLLARNATGQQISVFTSHFHRPKPKGEMHIIIVDNGRSQQLGRTDFRNSLKCIRCGACLNTCPVYRLSGGHSYNATVPGPIGSVLGSLKKPDTYADLPFACTLCGSCRNICPVKIDLDHQLYAQRQKSLQTDTMKHKRVILKTAAKLMQHPKIFTFTGKVMRFVLPKLPKSILYHRKNIWARYRQMPEIPKHSFKELYQKEKDVQKR
ncbi:MAG: 4Fe-4S ferredoxin, partial [Sulfurospirillum sp.]